MTEQVNEAQQAILAGGCFWCVEAVFLQLSGVQSVESGYIGGTTLNPSYEAVCKGDTGHAEAIRVTYDPAVIGYSDLLDVFFVTHDPTTLNRQGNDVGTQYRSAIFPLNDGQKADAQNAINRAKADYENPIVTSIEKASIWYPAEDYHQNYWSRMGAANPYCMAVIPPKLQKLRKAFADRLGA